MQILEAETWEETQKVTGGTVAHEAMERGIGDGEPLLYAMNGMLRYAKAYRLRFDSPLSEDYVLGPAWFQVVSGLRRLLNGDGAVAMERGISTDSKDNRVIEAIYWHACKAAGIDGDTGEPFENTKHF